MIRLTFETGGVQVEAKLVRQPSVYLDHDSLTDIARTDHRRRRFLDIWRGKGELLFSYANALDISGPQGDTARYIGDLLEAIGPYWIPLELNPWKVAMKENGEDPSSGTPCVSESFLRGYFLDLRDDVTNLGRVVDLIQKDRDDARADVQRLKTHAAEMVTKFQSDYRSDPASLDHLLPAIPYDPARPTTFLLRQLERLVAREKDRTWTANDGVDFMHASVAGSCADFLLLDKAWKSRVLSVAPPKAYNWLYYRYELDAFLDAFENCTVGR